MCLPPFRGSSWLPKVLRLHVIRVSTKLGPFQMVGFLWVSHLNHPIRGVPPPIWRSTHIPQRCLHKTGNQCASGLSNSTISVVSVARLGYILAVQARDMRQAWIPFGRAIVKTKKTFSPQHVSLLMRVCLDARGHLTSFDRFP